MDDKVSQIVGREERREDRRVRKEGIVMIKWLMDATTKYKMTLL